MMPTNGSKDHTVPHQECVLGIETLQHKTKKKHLPQNWKVTQMRDF